MWLIPMSSTANTAGTSVQEYTTDNQKQDNQTRVDNVGGVYNQIWLADMR